MYIEGINNSFFFFSPSSLLGVIYIAAFTVIRYFRQLDVYIIALLLVFKQCHYYVVSVSQVDELMYGYSPQTEQMGY
jgi:hypothetical protein